jgi:hypothetical protein
VTSTENRLTDALAAAARAVPAETLRPLTVPRARRRARRRAWLPWLAPLAAAAGVALVIGLATALTSRTPGPPAAAAAAPPRYYVDMDDQGTTVVRATATGAITATLPDPYGAAGGAPPIANADHRTFFVGYLTHHKEIIYRFRLTGSGKVSGFAPVKGGTLVNAQNNDAMAASPDGSRLAVAVNSNPQFPDEIIVIDLRTGARTVWQGGMNRPRLKAFSISGLSWTAGGQELVFSAQWCAQADALGKQVCDAPGMMPRQRRDAEVWALDPGSAGGKLNSGRLLLRQSPRYPYLAGAVISRDGSALTALVLSGPERTTVPSRLSVVRISVADGRQQRVLYRRATGPTFSWNLSPDSSGRFWLLDGSPLIGAVGEHGFNGWIAGGRLVPLLPVGGDTFGETW